MGFIKGKSAIHIARVYAGRRRNFVGQHSWARGYWVSAVGKNEAAVRQYIQDQAKDTHNPVKGVERPIADANEGKTPAIGDGQARALPEAPAHPGTLERVNECLEAVGHKDPFLAHSFVTCSEGAVPRVGESPTRGEPRHPATRVLSCHSDW